MLHAYYLIIRCSLHLSVCVAICLSVNLFDCLSVDLSVYLHVYLSIYSCHAVYLFVRPSINPTIYLIFLIYLFNFIIFFLC